MKLDLKKVHHFFLRTLRGRTTRSAYAAELAEGLPPLGLGWGLLQVQAGPPEALLLFWVLGVLGLVTGAPFVLRAVARRLHDSGRSLNRSLVLLPAVGLWAVLQVLEVFLLGVPGQLAAALSWTTLVLAVVGFLVWVGSLAPAQGVNRYGTKVDDYMADGSFVL